MGITTLPRRPPDKFMGSRPVLGRPAPAHLHRPRARHGARAADRRRGGLRARRVGAEAGARAARRDPPAAQPRRAVHHPRPARRRADLRLRRGDEQGQGRRIRLGQQVFGSPRDEYTKALFAPNPHPPPPPPFSPPALFARDETACRSSRRGPWACRMQPWLHVSNRCCLAFGSSLLYHPPAGRKAGVGGDDGSLHQDQQAGSYREKI